MSKAKHKPIRKFTKIKSNIPGESLFVDIGGLYKKAINGIQYWVQVVDDCTRMGFCYFLKHKGDVAAGLETLLNKFKIYKHTPRYLHCDNTGENEKQIQDVMLKFGIQPEFTSTDTPQFNGVAERRITTLKL